LAEVKKSSDRTWHWYQPSRGDLEQGQEDYGLNYNGNFHDQLPAESRGRERQAAGAIFCFAGRGTRIETNTSSGQDGVEVCQELGKREERRGDIQGLQGHWVSSRDASHRGKKEGADSKATHIYSCRCDQEEIWRGKEGNSKLNADPPLSGPEDPKERLLVKSKIEFSGGNEFQSWGPARTGKPLNAEETEISYRHDSTKTCSDFGRKDEAIAVNAAKKL